MKTPRELLPWHQSRWDQLQARRRDGRLPHALMLTGPAGLGKELFALQAAWSLLCKQPDLQGMPCGECQGCGLLVASSHPDLMWVTQPPAGKDGRVADADKTIIRVDHNAEPGKRGRQILVDQARALIEQLGFKSQIGERKIAVISPADRMIWNAANALLKTLEEPAPDTLLILVATDPARLPATVRSRCQRMEFHPPSSEAAVSWLAPRLPDLSVAELQELLLAGGGAPLRALALHESGALGRRSEALQAFLGVAERREDAVNLAQAWVKDPGLKEATEWLHDWCCELIRLRMGGSSKPGTADLHGVAESVDLMALFDRFSEIEQARALTETNLRPELVLVDLLSSWTTAERQR